ncbi:MAG: hypothetical protein ACO1NX_05630 [Chitinophagaceae bacterium]
MTIQQYKALKPDEQTSFLCKAGVSIAERKVGPYLIVLFQVEGFYVEVFYNAANYQMVKLVSFYNTTLLEPYLSDININSLVPPSAR